ncbi:hypothetical protein [Nocardia cyriacigeorgica]|uniref:hypothetical protein n=1 Tax=Nocardia cyriacigeorgica TaxID=135487 RepID=UPI00351146BE
MRGTLQSVWTDCKGRSARPFLAAGGHADEQVEAMFQAWFKAVTLQVTLWAQPYAGADW